MNGEFTKTEMKKEIQIKLGDLDNINVRMGQVIQQNNISEAKEMNKRMLALLHQIMVEELGMKAQFQTYKFGILMQQ